MSSPSQAPDPKTRIEKYGFVAHIITSQHGSSCLFHYLIQRDGSAEIIHWGQELSFQRALECVEEHLETLRAHSA